jgi:hypothetical protein
MTGQEKWSKIVLIVGTMLAAYSAAALVFAHMNPPTEVDMAPPQRPKHHPLHCISSLGLVVGLTAMLAGYTSKRGYARLYLYVLLLAEIAIVGMMCHAAVKRIRRCPGESEVQVVSTQVSTLEISPDFSIVGISFQYLGTALDENLLLLCERSVKKTLIIASTVWYSRSRPSLSAQWSS